VFPIVENTALALTTAKYYTPSGRLIQRDYSNVSFFDYYYRNNTATRNTNDVKMTDGGRTVYGGGGISPDEKFTPAKLDSLEAKLLISFSFPNYTKHFFAVHHEKLSENWNADDKTMNEFHAWLLEQKLDFTEAEFTQDYQWIEHRLQSEIYKTGFNIEASDRYEIRIDPEVEAAVNALPKATALLANAKKIVAERVKK
jgi:carboxyl-terminal processing protease